MSHDAVDVSSIWWWRQSMSRPQPQRPHHQHQRQPLPPPPAHRQQPDPDPRASWSPSGSVMSAAPPTGRRRARRSTEIWGDTAVSAGRRAWFVSADIIFVSLLTSLECQIVLAANTVATRAPGSWGFRSTQLAVKVLGAKHRLLERLGVKAISARNISAGRRSCVWCVLGRERVEACGDV